MGDFVLNLPNECRGDCFGQCGYCPLTWSDNVFARSRARVDHFGGRTEHPFASTSPKYTRRARRSCRKYGRRNLAGQDSAFRLPGMEHHRCCHHRVASASDWLQRSHHLAAARLRCRTGFPAQSFGQLSSTRDVSPGPWRSSFPSCCLSTVVVVGFSLLVPAISEQSAEFASSLPETYDAILEWVGDFGQRFNIDIGVPLTEAGIQRLALGSGQPGDDPTGHRQLRLLRGPADQGCGRRRGGDGASPLAGPLHPDRPANGPRPWRSS